MRGGWKVKGEGQNPLKPPSSTELWAVRRVDDNGNTFLVQTHLVREEAERLVEEFTARGHKQTYWAEREA